MSKHKNHQEKEIFPKVDEEKKEVKEENTDSSSDNLKKECQCSKEKEKQESLKQEVEDGKKQIEVLNQKIGSLQEALLRNQAELQNYKRRKDEENEKVLKYKN